MCSRTRERGARWWRRAWRGDRLRLMGDRRATGTQGRPGKVAPTTNVARRPSGKSKLYTRTGDLGTTMLFGGGRLPKGHPRVEAYGTVDELNSTLGVALSFLPSRNVFAKAISGVQNELFNIGSELASGGGGKVADKARLFIDAEAKVGSLRQRSYHHRVRAGVSVRANPFDVPSQPVLLRLRGRAEAARPLAPAPVRPGGAGDDNHLGFRPRRVSAPRRQHALPLGVRRQRGRCAGTPALRALLCRSRGRRRCPTSGDRY